MTLIMVWHTSAFKENLAGDYKLTQQNLAVQITLLLGFAYFLVNTQPQQAEKQVITLQETFYLVITSQKPSI